MSGLRAVATRPVVRTPLRSIGARRALLLLGTSLAVYAVAAPGAAIAQNECGPPPPGGGTVTCSPSGNPYPNGVNYDPVVQDLTVVLEQGVVVTGGVEMGTAVPAVDLSLQAGAGTQISSSAAGREGVDVQTTSGAVSIGVAAVSSTGLRAEGIQAETVSGAIAIVSGAVTTQGNGSDGILARTASGAITITSASVTTAGNTILGQPGVIPAGAHGIEALSVSGPITITSTSIATGGTNANGIVAGSESGEIDITSGTITAADGRGIEAQSESGDINIQSGSVTTVGGLFSDGIFAQSETGGIVIDSGSVSVGHGVGIFVISGSGDVAITSDEVIVTGNISPGIAAYGDYYVGGDINVVSGSVRTSGNFSNGIDVSSRGLVSVQSDNIVTTGTSSRGIEASSDSGGVVIDSGSIATSGANSRGIQVNVYNEAGVVITSGSITTLGDNGDGIIVATFGDDSTGDFEITSGSVSTQGHRSIGIYAYHAGSGDIVVTSGSVTTAGDSQDVAYGTSHAIELHANSGSVTVTSATVGTTGSGAVGILATSESGGVGITSGSMTTSGANAHGIVAQSGSGGVIVDSNNISVTGAGANAIMLQSATASTLTIRGLTSSAQGLAVQAEGGPATISILAGGTIRGRVDLTGGADRIDNAGTFDAIGTSQFGGGADVFNNSGTTRSVNGAAVLASVDTFNSSGRIEMNDGAANDRLTIGGTYNGLPGSRLALDVNFATGTADVLVTGLATGTTGIEVNAIGQSQGGFTSTGILLVDAGPGTQASAFTLVGGATTSNAYVTSGLVFDAANFNFLLANAPNQPVFETAIFGEAASLLWHRGADAVSAQLDAARDGGAGGDGHGGNHLRAPGRLGAWAQLVGAKHEREASQAFGASVFDTSYEQDYRGIQAGIDHEGGGLTFGLTFGTGRSDVRFDTSLSTLDLDVLNVGAYVQIQSGSFFANAIAKVAWIDAETNPGPGLAASFDATAIGARLTAGFRFDLGGMWAEPAASLSWVNVDIDDYVSGGATIAFEDATSLRGSLGVRVGGDFAAGAGTLSPSLGIHLIEEFNGRNRNAFTFGSTLALAQDAPGTFGRASAGLTYSSGSLQAFIRGELDFGGEIEGHGGRVGLRLLF